MRINEWLGHDRSNSTDNIFVPVQDQLYFALSGSQFEAPLPASACPCKPPFYSDLLSVSLCGLQQRNRGHSLVIWRCTAGDANSR